MLARISNFVSRRQKTFYYSIAGEDYTLDDIKHGMLRRNQAKSGHIWRVLSPGDKKTELLPTVSISSFP